MVKLELNFIENESEVKFTVEQKAIIEQAATFLIEALNNEIFSERILNYEWKRKRGKLQERFNHTKDSREVVLGKILSGDDKYSVTSGNIPNQIGDNDIDINILPYKAKKDKVGKTYRNSPKTWLNINNLSYRLGKYDKDIVICLTAQNLIHEYCHNLGYKHKRNKKHKFNNVHSVPYAVGEIVRSIIAPNIKNQIFENIEDEVCMHN